MVSLLTHTPLLHPPDYSRDYFLYLVASDSTIAMVLVQEDDLNDEHVVYYLSKSLSPTEIKYSHVEKLALVVVQVVQRFRHYILLHKTTIIFYCNPMQHILTRQVLGGNTQNGFSSYKSLIWNLKNPNLRNIWSLLR
jgi:hypothetical protein